MITKVLTHLKVYFKRFDYLGLSFALIFLCYSLTPSLMPRPSLYQGLISGISMVIGYGIGVLINKLLHWVFDIKIEKALSLYAWRVLAILALTLSVMYFSLGSYWQNQIRQLLDMPELEQAYGFKTAFITVVCALFLLFLARSISKLSRTLSRSLARFLPRKAAVVGGVVLTVLCLVLLVDGVFIRLFVNVTNEIYANENRQTTEGSVRPEASERSGSPASLVSWESLGQQGRAFVGRGPTPVQLEDFNGIPAQQPIRVYVGVESAQTAQDRAKLALQELERTGAFEREILVIANATGTGWLEPQSVDSLEYMYNGNSAIATIQYSYLPSWISFLVDKDNATNAGKALFDEVYGKWASMPENNRPKLIAYGLSLGSFAGQSAFSGVNDVKYSTDGALFVGTPSETALWRTITDNRDKGSPEILPVYNNGQTVRFASNADLIASDTEGWQGTRVLYLQHASDPVVWFNFNLILHKPDWLKEPRGADVSPAMGWHPFVTFLQVTIDQFFGVSVPNGHGHNYPNIIVAAWDAVTQPKDWSQEKTNTLQALINTYRNE